MMTITTGTTYGAAYSYEAQADGILAYVDGDDTRTSHEKDVLVEALFAELRDEVDNRLPDGVSWQPRTSEFVHPVDVDLPDRDEMNELFTEAWQAVEARYEQIERRLFGALPATVEDLEAELRAIADPIRRARVAGLLVDAGMRQMAGRVRAEAVYEASRERSRGEVARLLGTGTAAVGKLIYEHNQRSDPRGLHCA